MIILSSPEVPAIPPVIREVFHEAMEEMSRPRIITVTGLPGGLPAVFEDPSLPHQIILTWYAGWIAVSCNCLRRFPHQRHRGAPKGIIEARPVFPAPAAVRAYQRWHQDRGTGTVMT